MAMKVEYVGGPWNGKVSPLSGQAFVSALVDTNNLYMMFPQPTFSGNFLCIRRALTTKQEFGEPRVEALPKFRVIWIAKAPPDIAIPIPDSVKGQWAGIYETAVSAMSLEDAFALVDEAYITEGDRSTWPTFIENECHLITGDESQVIGA